jgi:hypothetical protein
MQLSFRFHRIRSPKVTPRDPKVTSAVARVLRLLSVACVAALAGNIAARADEVVAIASKVSKDYVRKRLPDGSIKPESYVFGQGDTLGGARVDPTIDKMDFMDVARVIAVPLADKRYLPTADPKTTNLLVMVYWGTTRAPEYATESNSHQEAQLASVSQANAVNDLKDFHPLPTKPTMTTTTAGEEVAAADAPVLAAYIGIQAENQRREDADMKTATLLGYDSWWVQANGAIDGSPLGRRKADMRAELEEDRYFVVLSAFDYQALVKTRKMKFLWEVRFSIREHGAAFDERLAGMVAKASDYFGRNSNGLQHVDVPAGKVKLGEIRSLGVLSENDAAQPAKGPAPSSPSR